LNIILHYIASAQGTVKPVITMPQQSGILDQGVGRVSGINLARLPFEIRPLLQLKSKLLVTPSVECNRRV
jgi:hypothetical protein